MSEQPNSASKVHAALVDAVAANAGEATRSMSTAEIASRFEASVGLDKKSDAKTDDPKPDTPTGEHDAKANAEVADPPSDDDGATDDAAKRQQSKQADDAKPSKKDAGITPVELDKSKQLLKRNQIGDDVIALMSEQQIVEAGKKLAKREADRERDFQMRKQVESIMAEKAITPHDKPKEGEAGKAAQPADWLAQELSALNAAIEADELYADLKDPLNKVVSSLAQRLEQQAERMQQVQKQYEDQMTTIALEREAEQIRSAAEDAALGDLYPEAKDPENAEKLRETVYLLAHSDKDRVLFFDEQGAPRWGDLVESAARKLFGAGRDPQKQAQARLAQTAKHRTNNAVTSDTSSDKARPRSMDFKEIGRMAFAELKRGKTPDQVNALLASHQ